MRPDTDASTLLNPGQFSVGAALTGRQAVLRLVGELDCGTAPLLRKALDELRGQEVSRLVLNMAELTFIDSSGLHELVVALKRQRETGGEAVLANPSPQTMRVLEMVGLSGVFTIV